MASFFQKLKAQVNPFDGGKSTASINQAEKIAQAEKNAQYERVMQPLRQKANQRLVQQAISGTIPIQKVPGFGVRKPEINQAMAYSQRMQEITDSKPDMNDYRNIVGKSFAQINPLDSGRSYTTATPSEAQRQRSSFGQSVDIGKGIVRSPIQFVNTAKAGAGGIIGLGRIGASSIIGSDQDYANTVSGVQQTLNRDLSPNSGLLGMGTYFKNAQEAQDLTPQRLIGKSINEGTQIATMVAPIVPIKGLGVVGSRLVNNAAQSGVGSAVGQQVENGRINPVQVIKDTATGTALGEVGNAVGSSIKATTKLVADPIVQTKVLDTAGKATLTRTLAKQDPTVQGLEKRINNNVTLAATLKGAEKAAKLDEIRELIRLRNARTKELSGTGAIGKDVRPDAVKEIDQVSQAVEKQLTEQPIQKQSKFASKTAQQSPEVSSELRSTLKGSEPKYEAVTDIGRMQASDEFLKKTDIRKATTNVKERLASKNIDDQTVSDAIAVAKKLDSIASPESLLEASAIYEQLSVKLTEAGQTVQAASLLNNRTPEGLQYGALRALKKGGVTIDDTIRKEVKDFTEIVRKQKAGSYEDGLARFKLQEYVSKKVPSSNSSKLIQIWKAGLLTSPRTTAGNIAANTAETIFNKGYVDPLANLTDAVMSIFTGSRSRSFTAKGMASGAVEGTQKGIKYFKTGYDPRNPAQKFDVKNVHFSDKPLGKAAEAYTQTVFKLMGAQDQPFYYANLRNSLYDQAITQAKNKGLKGAEKQTFIKQFITEPEKKTMQLADAEARYSVFQNETALGKAASRLKNMDGLPGDIADFVVPFSGVPSSIATRMVERTPIGTATEIVRQLKSKNFDQRALTKAIANGTAVIPIAGAGYALAQAGMMTLGYPKDQKEQKLWEADGRQPYSIKVGGTWLSTNYFQPAGNLLAAGAEYAGQIQDGKSAQEAFNTSIAGAGKALSEQSFLQGISGVANAINDPARFGQKFAEQTAGSIVPNIVRTTARATDPKDREQGSMVDAFKAGVPGLRQSLQERNDLFGRPIERRSTTPNEMINPFKPSDVKNKGDKVLEEVKRLQSVDNGVVPKEANKKSFKDFDSAKLNEVNKEIGTKVREEWQKVIADKRYQSMSDGDKKRMLERANETVYESLKAKYLDDKNISKRADKYYNGYAVDYFDGFEYENPTDMSKAVFGDNPTQTANNKLSSEFKNLGLPEVSLNDDQTYEYAKLLEELPSLNKIDQEKKQKSFYTDVYKSQLDDVSKSFYSLGDDEMRYQLEQGTITQEQMDKIISLDNLLTSEGLQDNMQVGKTLREELGYGIVESGSGMSSYAKKASSKSSAKGKKGKKISISKGDSINTSDILKKTISIGKSSSKSKTVKINPNAIVAKSKVQIKRKK